jgi:6-phosphogluconate dehydrogenase
MQFGMLGLGRMGAYMAGRLLRGGHNQDPAKVAELVQQGAAGAGSLADLVRRLQPPRIVWLMLPAGDVTAEAIGQLAEVLDAGDIVVDGGNSHYQDYLARREWLTARGSSWWIAERVAESGAKRAGTVSCWAAAGLPCPAITPLFTRGSDRE